MNAMNTACYFLIFSILFGITLSKKMVTKVPNDDGSVSRVMIEKVADEARKASSPMDPNPRHKLWPKGKVPYVVADQYTSSERRLIVNSLAEISRKTDGCIKFIPRTNQANYVEIFKSGNGCYAYVGEYAGRNLMSLSVKGNGVTCVTGNTIIHEALHSLGFLHAQQRRDSRKYVRVHSENIQPDTISNFVLQPTYNEIVPFDFKTVMMYGSSAFSRNGKPTMESKVRYAKIMGHQPMSRSDVEMIKRLYRCSF